MLDMIICLFTGRHKQKQCFVKYKGLAHIHNRWVPGIHLVHEDPEFREKPGKEKKVCITPLFCLQLMLVTCKPELGVFVYKFSPLKSFI